MFALLSFLWGGASGPVTSAGGGGGNAEAWLEDAPLSAFLNSFFLWCHGGRQTYLKLWLVSHWSQIGLRTASSILHEKQKMLISTQAWTSYKGRKGIQRNHLLFFSNAQLQQLSPLAETVTVGQALETVTHFLDLIQHLHLLFFSNAQLQQLSPTGWNSHSRASIGNGHTLFRSDPASYMKKWKKQLVEARPTF